MKLKIKLILFKEEIEAEVSKEVIGIHQINKIVILITIKLIGKEIRVWIEDMSFKIEILIKIGIEITLINSNINQTRNKNKKNLL